VTDHFVNAQPAVSQLASRLAPQRGPNYTAVC